MKEGDEVKWKEEMVLDTWMLDVVKTDRLDDGLGRLVSSLY